MACLKQTVKWAQAPLSKGAKGIDFGVNCKHEAMHSKEVDFHRVDSRLKNNTRVLQSVVAWDAYTIMQFSTSVAFS